MGEYVGGRMGLKIGSISSENIRVVPDIRPFIWYTVSGSSIHKIGDILSNDKHFYK